MSKTIWLLVQCWLLFSIQIAKAEKFKVGMILPLSGATADYGQSIENSIKLAQADFPDLFSNIEFIYEDALYDPKLAVSAFQRLITINKVNLVYTWGVAFCRALAPIAESKKVPMIGQCIDQESSRDKKYVVRFMNYTDEYLSAQTEYLAKKGYKKIGVLLTDNTYLEEMYQALLRNLKSGQSVEVIDRYQSNDFNLRSSISKLKHNNFDVIGVFLAAGQISQYYKQADEQKLETPSFGTNFFESLSEVKLAGGTMNNAIFANNKVEDEFLKKYQSAFHNTSQLGFGALAYEFSLVIGKLFNSKVDKLDSEKILQMFATIKEGRGYAAGDFFFKNSSDAGQYYYFPIAIKRIYDQSFQVVASY